MPTSFEPTRCTLVEETSEGTLILWYDAEHTFADDTKTTSGDQGWLRSGTTSANSPFVDWLKAHSRNNSARLTHDARGVSGGALTETSVNVDTSNNRLVEVNPAFST